jgi:hypothetical protein
MNRVQRELFPIERVHSPYDDWYAVYRVEVTDRIKHWPSNRKVDMDSDISSLTESIQGIIT